MNRRWMVIGLGVLVVLAGSVAAMSTAFQDGGDEDGFKDVLVFKMEKRQVTFDHATHAAEYADDCTTCHHTSPEGEGQACGKCHPRHRNRRGDDTIVRIVAMHRQCKGCHQEMEAGPTEQCEDCHVPRN